MKKAKLEGNGSVADEAAETEIQEATSTIQQKIQDNGDLVATAATVAVVGVGAAVFEAALIPGLVLGIAAVALPKYFPKIGDAIAPVFRHTVRGAYKFGQKTKEMVAEAHEQVHDIVAEVHAEKSAEPVKVSATH
jgi:hypothetical protein